MQLGDLRGAREDMKQAHSNADALTQQSIVNALYSVERLLSAELVPVSTTRRGRAVLRRWLHSWRKLACRDRERSLLAQRLQAVLGVATPRQQVRRAFLSWRSTSVRPGANAEHLTQRRQLAAAWLRSHREALLNAALSGWAQVVASTRWLPRAAERRADLLKAAKKEMWQLYWQTAAIKRVRARWFPEYFVEWQAVARRAAPQRQRRLQQAAPAAAAAAPPESAFAASLLDASEPAHDNTLQPRVQLQLRVQQEPEPEPEPELYDVEAVAALVPRSAEGSWPQQHQGYERATKAGFPWSVVAARVAERARVLHRGFRELKIGQLRKQAVAEGIQESVADSILDGADPLGDLAEALALHVAYRPQHRTGKLSKEGSGCVTCRYHNANPASDGAAELMLYMLQHAPPRVVRKSILRSASKMQRRYFELDDEFLCYYQNTKSAK